MINLQNINKYYPFGEHPLHVIKDISLVINKGDFITLMGKSGSGKTTLLNIIGCLDSFDSGIYTFNDLKINCLNDKKLAKLRNKEIGFVFQDFSLINQKSVEFNVMLPLFFDNISLKNMKERAQYALELVGIPEQIHKKTNQLSGGQRQRVAIARAIVNNPSVILADEPTGALDTDTSNEILELLSKMNESGNTIVIVSHDKMVASYCKKILNIKDGVLSDYE